MLVASMDQSHMQAILTSMAEISKAILARIEKEKQEELAKANEKYQAAFVCAFQNSESTQEEKEIALEYIAFSARLIPAIADYYAKKATLEKVAEEVQWRAISALQWQISKVDLPGECCVAPYREMTHEDYLKERIRCEKILASRPTADDVGIAALCWIANEGNWATQQKKDAATNLQAANATIEATVLSPQMAALKAQYTKRKRMLTSYLGSYFFSQETRSQAALEFYEISKAEKKLAQSQSQPAAQ